MSKTSVGPILDARVTISAGAKVEVGLLVVEEAARMDWPTLIRAFDRDRKREEKSMGPISGSWSEGAR